MMSCKCRACKPDSGYDIEFIKIREEQEKRRNKK